MTLTTAKSPVIRQGFLFVGVECRHAENQQGNNGGGKDQLRFRDAARAVGRMLRRASLDRHDRRPVSHGASAVGRPPSLRNVAALQLIRR